MNCLNTCVVLGLTSFLTGGVASAQFWRTYDAGLGTFPQDQCWTHIQDLNPVVGYPLSIDNGQLSFSTLGLATSGAIGGGVYWLRDDVSINFTSNFAVEARVKILQAPNRSINQQNGWPRPGYGITVVDVTGRVFWVGFGNNEIFLSNSLFGQYGSANTVTLAFNTTDAFHTYRIERGTSGTGATLRIDGVPRLSIASAGVPESGSGLVYFGDPTYWANSESLTTMVRYTSNAACTADFNGDATADFFDYLDFVDVFSDGTCSADFNGDGAVDFFDYLDFVDAFSTGC